MMFTVEGGRVEQHDWILDIPIIVGTKVQLELTILIFEPNLPNKGISNQKRRKWKPPLDSAYSNYSSYQILV